MSTFLLLSILVGMLGVAVMIIYVIDKIHSIEKHAHLASGAANSGGAAIDDRFAGLEGEQLWQTMTGMPAAGADPQAIDELRKCYEPVLLRHIGELLEEGVLDGQQGIQVKPNDLRTIKTTHGQVVSWIPPEEARMIYDLGLDRQRTSQDNLAAIRERLDETCDRLFASLGLIPTQRVSRVLMPEAEPAQLPAVVQTIAPELVPPASAQAHSAGDSQSVAIAPVTIPPSAIPPPGETH